jgi:ketosteroid isomerase-like protein
MMCGMDLSDEVVAALFERCRRDHAAWINGDMSGYTPLPDEATIMGAFGGSLTSEQAAARGVQSPFRSPFEHGSGDVELVSAGVSGDVAWLVMIERASVMFTGHEQSRRWELRATELFRREGDDWVRFHRHADALVDFHSLDDVLALLAG